MGWYFSLGVLLFSSTPAFSFFDPCYLLFGRGLNAGQTQQKGLRSYYLRKQMDEIQTAQGENISTVSIEDLKALSKMMEDCRVLADEADQNFSKHWIEPFLTQLGHKISKVEEGTPAQRFLKLKKMYGSLYNWRMLFYQEELATFLQVFRDKVADSLESWTVTADLSPEKLFEPIDYVVFREQLLRDVPLQQKGFRLFQKHLDALHPESLELFDLFWRPYWFELTTREFLKQGMLRISFRESEHILSTLRVSNSVFRVVMNDGWQTKQKMEQQELQKLVEQFSPALKPLAELIPFKTVPKLNYLQAEDFPWVFWLQFVDTPPVLPKDMHLKKISDKDTAVYHLTSFLNFLHENGISKPLLYFAEQLQKETELAANDKVLLFRFLLDVQLKRIQQRLEGIDFKYGQRSFSTHEMVEKEAIAKMGRDIFDLEFQPLYKESETLVEKYYLPLVEQDPARLAAEKEGVARKVTQNIYALARSIGNESISEWAKSEFSLVRQAFEDPSTGEETPFMRELEKIYSKSKNRIFHVDLHDQDQCRWFIQSYLKPTDFLGTLSPGF